MINQLVSGPPQASQPVNNNTRDRKQASGEKDDASGSFEDIISKAGQHQSRKEKPDRDDVDLPTVEGAKRQSSADALPKVSFDLSAALRGLSNATQGQVTQNQVTLNQATQGKLTPNQLAQGQVKIANVKEALKAAIDRSDMTEKQAEAVMAKLVEKLNTAAAQTEQIAQKLQQAADAVQVDSDLPMSPADELEMLLGLVSSKDSDAKPSRKAEDDDSTAAKEDEGPDIATDKLDAKADTARAENMPIAANAKSDSSDAPESDSSSQGDVVRLVSANGRGRSVDIEVPAATGDGQKDTAKSSNAPKLDTATVLEARRYLGFTPEPNGTALATAIKADPTWTSALHAAAQRSDLGSLGNTTTEVNTLKLQMNPENLGNMVASLKLKGEELTVELRVDTVEAYRHLSADHDDIVKSLQDQGFSIDKVTVQLNATEKTDTGADRDMARQGQAQRDGQAQQREGQGGRNDARSNEQSRRTTTADAPEHASGDGRTEPDRAGNIYL